MAFNIEKARKDGRSDQEIRAYLTKSGRAPDEIEALMKGHGEIYAGVSHYAKPAMEFGGMLGGQMLGGAAGALTSPITGPAGPIAGRMAGGTVGNVAGGVGGDVLRSLMGTQSPGKILSNIPQEAKEGGIASAFGEMIPGGLKVGGAIKRAISPDMGIAKGASELPGMITGQSGSAYRQLAKNPRAILPRWLGGYQGAKRAFDKTAQTVEEKYGVPKAYQELGDKLSLKAVRDHVDDVVSRIKFGKKVSLHDAYMAFRGIGKRLITGGEELSEPLQKAYASDKKEIMRYMWEKYPDVAGKLQDEANSQLSKSFHTPFFGLAARTGSGKGQGYKMFYELRRLAPLIAGIGTGNPEVGIGLGALMSPLATGIPVAAGGAVGKALQSPRIVSATTKALRKLRGGDE